MASLFLRRLCAVLVSLAICLGFLEALCRIFLPNYAPKPSFKFRVENAHYNFIDKNSYRASARLGVEPIPGGEYDDRGIIRNGFPTRKDPGVTRILFLGDSVTHRRIYVDETEKKLRATFPGRKLEFWNGAVEGYNAVQSAAFFELKGSLYSPDICVLGFHLNDFTSTPVAYLDKGKLVVFTPGKSLYKTHLFSAWFFTHSTAYRTALMAAEKRWFMDRHFEEEIYQDTLKAVERIRAHCQATGVRFVVLVIPYIKPDGEYTPQERHNYDGIITYLKQNQVEHADLKPVFDHVGIDRVRGYPGDGLTNGTKDPWHPNRAGHEIMAEVLSAQLTRILDQK